MFMPPFENPYWNEVPYMHGWLTMDASDLVELLSPPKGNDLYRNMTYNREKMQYAKPGEVCDFGVKKGDNTMNEKYEFVDDGFVVTAINDTAYIDTDTATLIAERNEARLAHVNTLRREDENKQKAKKAMTIENVIFNPPATIVFWADGTKTVVKCQSDGLGDVEPFDPEKGLAMAFMKKMLGNKGNYYNIVDKWVHPYWQDIYDRRAAEIEKELQEKFKEELNSKKCERSNSEGEKSNDIS
jgi:hypothetical protein